MKKIICLLTLLGISWQVQAITYNWPVVERVTKTWHPQSDGWRVHFYTRVVTYNEPSWPDNITLQQALFNAGVEKTLATSDYKLTVFGTRMVGWVDGSAGFNQHSSTSLARVAEVITGTFSRGHTWDTGQISYLCYSLGVGKVGQYTVQWNGNPNYGRSDCLKPPPENIYCAMETENINSNLGSRRLDQFLSMTFYEPLKVYCSDEIKYSVRLLGGGDKINLDNGMKAKLTVNDKPLMTTVFDGKPGSQTVSLGMKLEGKTSEYPSFFSGKGVLLIGYP